MLEAILEQGGVRGSTEPGKSTSLPSGEKACNVMKKSASEVEDEMNSFAASGPVISVSSLSGADMNVKGSPKALNAMLLCELETAMPEPFF